MHRGREIAAALAVVLLFGTEAGGRHNHAHHHDVYQGWENGLDQGCCNDQDCGQLPDADERTDAGKLEVRIEGEWCPVLPHHYLKKGNVPNASVAHVCVLKPIVDDYSGAPDPRGPCERFICYQPRPLS